MRQPQIADAIKLQSEQRTDAALILMQREIDNLRAEVRSQAARLAQLRPLTPSGVPAWASAFERRLDVIAAELARLQG